MLKRLSGTSVAADRPSTNIFQNDSGDTASCGKRKEKPMIAMSSILPMEKQPTFLDRRGLACRVHAAAVWIGSSRVIGRSAWESAYWIQWDKSTDRTIVLLGIDQQYGLSGSVVRNLTHCALCGTGAGGCRRRSIIKGTWRFQKSAVP